MFLVAYHRDLFDHWKWDTFILEYYPQKVYYALLISTLALGTIGTAFSLLLGSNSLPKIDQEPDQIDQGTFLWAASRYWR